MCHASVYGTPMESRDVTTACSGHAVRSAVGPPACDCLPGLGLALVGLDSVTESVWEPKKGEVPQL